MRGRSRWLDVLLSLLFLVILYIFFIRRTYLSDLRQSLGNDAPTGGHIDNAPQSIDSPLLVPKKTNDMTKEEENQARTNEILDHIPDTRSDSCKAESHGSEIPTSFVIDFFDYSFYDIRVTISSVLKFTPESLIRDIVVIDDGSTLDHIIIEAQAYVDKIPKAILVRHEDRQGQGRSRMRGVKESMGANIVFLDSNAVVTPGWLEPLASYIQKEQHVVAVPHLNRIKDPVSYEFIKTDNLAVASINLNLEIVMSRTKGSSQDVMSPAIRGSVFAITRDYFKQIGGLDPYLSDGGGDMLEMSLRTWLCGGSVKVVGCSKVGILNYNDPVKIMNNRNKWRISELWMSEYKDPIAKSSNRDLASNIGDVDKRSLQTRRLDIEKLQCVHDTKWYFDNIATDVFIPPTNAVVQGFLQIKNGHCARIGEDKRIDLGSCNPQKHDLVPRDMMFVLTSEGHLTIGSLCIGTPTSFYMIPGKCDIKDENQKWTYDNKKRLVNFKSKFCAMHVTDPDPKMKDQKRQIAMAQDCSADKSKDLEFSSWKFISD